MRLNDKNAGRHTKATFVFARLMLGFTVAMFSMFAASAEAKGGFCSQTANTLFAACKSGANDDSLVKKAVCINILDEGERATCFDELNDDRKESRELCVDQHDWRLDACKLVGEARYDPDIDPARFDNDFGHLTNPNAYFPLGIGKEWRYLSGDESDIVKVLNQTKAIDGITCVVVRDEVFKNGVLSEGTDDWYAQALDVNVWYCGENTAEYESVPGDNPEAPELVNIDGSFKAGRDGDKPGIIFLASPSRGDVYLEEFSLANAEDVTQVLSTSYAYGHNAELDQLVPRQLAERFCAGDCVVTKNFSLLEPGIFARKYYARGIGVILEVEPETQTISQLVGCNFDPRCDGLPTP